MKGVLSCERIWNRDISSHGNKKSDDLQRGGRVIHDSRERSVATGIELIHIAIHGKKKESHVEIMSLTGEMKESVGMGIFEVDIGTVIQE
jgi:hypothetical protein